MRIIKLVSTFLIILFASQFASAKKQADEKNNDKEKLVVVWTSGDPYVAERVALMYTHAAKKHEWFQDVTIIIWGPSAKLTSENQKIQEKLKAMAADGIEIRACISCANSYGIADELKELGFDVAGMGKPLTDYLKDDSISVISF